jgi:Helicase associated domain
MVIQPYPNRHLNLGVGSTTKGKFKVTFYCFFLHFSYTRNTQLTFPNLQRTAFRRKQLGTEHTNSYRLTTERLERLNAIGMVWVARECSAENCAQGSDDDGDDDEVSDECMYEDGEMESQEEANPSGACPTTTEAAATATPQQEDDDDDDENSQEGAQNGVPLQEGECSNTTSHRRRTATTTNTTRTTTAATTQTSAVQSPPLNKDRQDPDCRWESMMQQLVKFQKREGHCRVPTRYALNRRLGSWVMNQRRVQSDIEFIFLQPKRSNSHFQFLLNKPGLLFGASNWVLSMRIPTG